MGTIGPAIDRLRAGPGAMSRAGVNREASQDVNPDETKTSLRVVRARRGPVLVAEASQALVVTGYLGAETIRTTVAELSTADFSGNFGTMTLVSLDGRPRVASGRMLLTLSGRVENISMAASNLSGGPPNPWGEGPTIAQRVPLSLRIRGAPEQHVWALDSQGRRQNEVAVIQGRGCQRDCGKESGPPNVSADHEPLASNAVHPGAGGEAHHRRGNNLHRVEHPQLERRGMQDQDRGKGHGRAADHRAEDRYRLSRPELPEVRSFQTSPITHS
jgi:hypothetical protein